MTIRNSGLRNASPSAYDITVEKDPTLPSHHKKCCSKLRGCIDFNENLNIYEFYKLCM